MKTLLPVVIGSVLVGLSLGGILAYVEVRPAAVPAEAAAKANSATSQEKIQVATDLPRVELPETVFEFDRIERGTSMRHSFAVKNQGAAPLVVRLESSTCKCTGVEFEGSLVQPGQSVSVPPGKQTGVTLEWTAQTAAGPFRHGARFSTNDPSTSSIELEVNGQVVESSSMRPSELLFGSVKSGKTGTAQLYLVSYLNDQVEVLDYAVTSAELDERIEVEITPAETSELPAAEARSGLKVLARFRAGAALGPFRGWLKMETNLPNAERLMVPIIGRVTGDISIYGPGWDRNKGLLRMGPVLAAEGKVVRLNLAVRGDHAQTTEFSLASVDPPELKVRVGESRKMGETLRHVPVEVEVPAHTRPLVRTGEPASTDALIVLDTTHPEAKEIRMRVHFSVSR